MFPEKPCGLSYLLLAAVCSLRPLGGAPECSAIVAEVTRRVHLVLSEVRQSTHWSNTNTDAGKSKSKNPLVHNTCTTKSLIYGDFLTSRISNLSVLTLLQVFLSLATGLMFIPAERQRKYEYTEYLQRQIKVNEQAGLLQTSTNSVCTSLNCLASA